MNNIIVHHTVGGDSMNHGIFIMNLLSIGHPFTYYRYYDYEYYVTTYTISPPHPLGLEHKNLCFQGISCYQIYT